MGILEGKTALITGGGKAELSNGGIGAIGYGIAVAYAKQGASLMLTGRNSEKLNAAKRTLEALYGVRVLTQQADIRAAANNTAIVQEVVRRTVRGFGGIDILVNNAQASASGVPLAEHTDEQFDLALYSGLYSCFLYMRECYPYLKRSRGSVINFASGAGLFGNFGQSSYAAAKEAIRALTRVAATEWGKDEINCNAVCPLSLTCALERWSEQQPQAFAKNVRAIPMGRYGDAEQDIGRICVQLASPDFKYMSGETLTVQGGSGLRP